MCSRDSNPLGAVLPGQAKNKQELQLERLPKAPEPAALINLKSACNVSPYPQDRRGPMMFLLQLQKGHTWRKLEAGGDAKNAKEYDMNISKLKNPEMN